MKRTMKRKRKKVKQRKSRTERLDHILKRLAADTLSHSTLVLNVYWAFPEVHL